MCYTAGQNYVENKIMKLKMTVLAVCLLLATVFMLFRGRKKSENADSSGNNEASQVQDVPGELAAVEEEDTVDGITDRWVQVSYKDYEGWIFGGHASAERGGPKYYIPEQLIAFDLEG